MASKKKIEEKEILSSDIPNPPGEGRTLEEADKAAIADGSKKPAPGTIIKEYVQNGLRYKRVATENGGTVDVRV